MKKINSVNGIIGDEDIYPDSNELMKEVLKLCIDSKVSYIEQNKALYMVDRELYERAINRNASKED